MNEKLQDVNNENTSNLTLLNIEKENKEVVSYENKTLHGEIETLRERIKHLESEENKLKATVPEKDYDCKEKLNEIKKLEIEVSFLKENILKFQYEEETLQQGKETLAQKLEEHEKLNSNLMSDNAEKSKSLTRLKAEVDSFSENEIILKRELEAQKEMIINQWLLVKQ